MIDLTDWPTKSGRLMCTPEKPMPKDAPGRWFHTTVEEVGEQRDGWPGGDMVTMRCCDCGETWDEELPQ